MKFTILLLLLVVTGGFVFSDAFAQESCTPSDTCNLSHYQTTTNITNPNFMQPAIAMNGNDITVVWQINVGVPDPVYFAKSHDGGLTFSAPEYLNHFSTAHHPDELWSWFDGSGNNIEGLEFINYSYPSMGNSNNITLQFDGNSYKVWHVNICQPDPYVSATCSPDNNEILLSKNNATPINLSNNITGSVGAVVAVDGNNVYVAWKDYSSGDTKAYVVRSTNGGVSFESPILVDSNPNNSMGGNSMNISIEASDGNVYAVWQNNDIIFKKINFDSTADMVSPIVIVPEYDLRLYGTLGSSQVVTFDVSATDDVGVVSGPTCTFESGDSIIISSGSSTNVVCSATDAAGNTGFANFSIYTDNDYEFTLPSECYDDIRHVSGDNPTPMTVSISGNKVTSSITMDWLGLGDITSKFVYSKNGQTVRVVDVPAPTNNYPTFTDTTTFSPGDYTVVSCLSNNFTGTLSGGGGGTWNKEPVTRYAELETFTISTGPVDTIPPIVVVPNNKAIQATSNNPSPVTFSASATDDIDGTLSPACTHASGDNFPIGTTAVTCTATDAAGNSSSESFTVTVTYDDPGVISNSIVVTTDRSSYDEGETIRITGEVRDLYSGTPVSVFVYHSNGDLVAIAQATVGADKKFSNEITAGGSLMKDEGTYTVTVTYGNENRSDETTFFYEGGETPIDDTPVDDTPVDDTPVDDTPVDDEPVSITVRTSRSSYDSNDTVVVLGNLTPLTSSAQITLEISKNGNWFFSQPVTTTNNGSYSFAITEHGTFQSEGKYIVKATYGNLTSEDDFEIEFESDNEPEPTPDFRLSFDISGMSILDVEEDNDNLSLIFTVDVSSPTGILEVTLPRTNFDSIFEGEDDDFFILVEGDFGDFTEIETNSQSRTLSIKIPPGTQDVEIIGSKLIGSVSNNFPIYDDGYEEELEIISLSTKKSQYRTGETIAITGKVSTYDFSIPVTLQVFTDGSLVDISQITVSLNETFSHTIIAEGPLWNENGKYTIRASYGEGNVKETSFVFRATDDSIPEPTPEPQPEVTIVPADGSGAPGCEETSQGCYIPSIASVALGGTVIFSNTDTAAHTFTSGDLSDSDTVGVLFDTSLLMRGSSYEWYPKSEGVVPYFCMVHPWMIGTILVGEGTLPHPIPEPPSEDHIDLNISVDGRIFDINTVVVLDIFLNGNSKTQNVAIDVTDPRGTTIISRSVEIGPNGDAGLEFKIDETFKTGNYKITATTSDGNRTVKDSTHFKVKSQFNSFKITSVDVTNQKGNPSDLEAGETGFIKVNLDSSKSIATLVTVNIFDAELTSIGIGSLQTTLSSGTSEIILSFHIPADAALGPADIYVNAFSDWPSEGGVPLTGEVSIVEDIQ